MKKMLKSPNSKRNVRLSLFLVILIVSSMIFTKWAISQPVSESTLPPLPVEIIQAPEDVQSQVKTLKECDLDRRELELRKEQDALKDQRIANLEKELALAQQEIVLKDRVHEIDEMEITATRRALADMTQVADRAIKLAETNKPSSGIWTIIGAAIGGILLGLGLAL